MHDREQSGRGKPVSRAAIVLGVLAGIEAAAIVALIVTRDAGPEAALPARVPASDGASAPLAPGFDAPRAPEASRAPSEDTAAEPLAAAASEASPQPLVATPSKGGDIGLVLCGTVAAEDGHALLDSEIKLKLSTRTGRIAVNQGAYAIAGLAPGPLTVTCSAAECLSQDAAVVLDAARPVEQLDFVLSPAPSVPVRFRSPDGVPLIEALDQAKVPGRLMPLVTLDPLAGEAPDELPKIASWLRLADLEASDKRRDALSAGGWDGVLELDVPLPVWVSANWGGRILASERVVDDSGVSFTIALETFLRELGSVRARVVGADGLPVPGALGELDNRQHLPFDAEARVAFERVPPGEHTLFIRPPGAWASLAGDSLMMTGIADADYGEVALRFTLAPGQRLDFGDIPLQRTVVVQGFVVDAAGRAISAPVLADRVDLDPEAPLAGRTYRARVKDEDGSFSIRVVPGRWSLRAGADAEDLPGELVDVRGDVADLRLVGTGVPIQR